MPHFPKPAAGSWTENYPDLGTAPVDMDYVFTVGCYALLAMAFNTFGIQLEHATTAANNVE